MQKKLFLLLVFVLLGCTSVTEIGEAPVITGPKNISILNKNQAQFKISSDEGATTYTITVNSVASRAAKFTIGEDSFIIRIGETKSIALENKNLFITLADVQDSTAIVTLSTTPVVVRKLSNGASCTSNSQCESNYCNNNFCCNAGVCCSITNDCPTGQRCLNNKCVTPEAQLCSDGTSYGNCSTSKPKYCSNGNLIDSCPTCGCIAGQVCNSTSNSCYIPPTAPLYNPQKAEELANRTYEGSLIMRFGTLFQNAKGCAAAAPAKIACLPTLGVETVRLNEGIYKTTYSYIFDSSCCSSSEVLRITTNLVSNSTSPQWVMVGLDENSLYSVNSSLSANCANAVNLLACR